MKVAVIGGGLSGIRAALTLARGGAKVTLFEKNRHLGGRVFSFMTDDFGEVDIGQHIWLRCCTALEQLLSDLAVPDEWIFRQERVAMTYRWPDGHVWHLAAARLPGSLAMLPVLFGARLTLAEKWHFVRGSLRASGYSVAEVEALDGISIAQWLQDNNQPTAVVQLFWEPFIVGVCNGRLTEVSARHALFAMRESLLKSAQAAAICWFKKPLSQVFDRHAGSVLRSAGVQVQTGTNVVVATAGPGVSVSASGSQRYDFDKVILALPLKRMRMLLPDAPLPQPPGEGAIAGLLLRFAAPVMEEAVFTAVGSPVQTVFDKSAVWGGKSADGSQVIELVLSAAEREVKLGLERLTAEMLPALAKVLPRTATTPLLAKRMLVHGTATFRVTPGGEGRRLPVTLPELPNVYLAGDLGNTGWPSTMESAVRAGAGAAKLVLEEIRKT